MLLQHQFTSRSASVRFRGFGNWDIYISYRTASGWSEPRNLGPQVNTHARDYSPRLAPDGHTLVFTSERHASTERRDQPLDYASLTRALRGITNGNGNIFTIDLRSLGVLPAQPSDSLPQATPDAFNRVLGRFVTTARPR